VLKAVVDTNQFVSGFLSKTGASARLMNAYRDGYFVLVISQEILDEIREVFSYSKIMQKYRLSPSEIEHFLELLDHHALKVFPQTHPDVVTEDPDDNKFLSCAAAAQADYIVSGDRHLLQLGRYQEISIVTVNEFLRIIGR